MANKIENEVVEIVRGPVKEAGLDLVDVEYKKEIDGMYLRIYIYSQRGISIDDCIGIHKAVENLIDEKVEIENSYTLEVSSPGYDRMFKYEEDFKRYMGQTVDVRLYKSIEGKKNFTGILTGYGNGRIEIESNETMVQFDETDVASVKRKFVV